MESIRQSSANVFGVLGMASLLCVAVGAIVMVAGIPMEYVAADLARVAGRWGTFLLDGGLVAAIVFGWLHRRAEKQQQNLRIRLSGHV